MNKVNTRSQDNKNEGDTLAVMPVPFSGPSAFDAEEYLPHLAEFDLSDAQARELLTTLWNIMTAFVDLGFGVDSVHRYLPALREISEELDDSAVDSTEANFSQNFEMAAREGAEKEGDS